MICRYAWFPVGVSAAQVTIYRYLIVKFTRIMVYAQIEAYFKAIPAACVPRFGTCLLKDLLHIIIRIIIAVEFIYQSFLYA